MANNEELYSFKSTKLKEKCSIGHFQLRNLVWAANKNNIYYVCDDTIRSWSPQRRKSKQVVDLRHANRPGDVSMKITSMACAHGVLFVGGFEGECMWKVVDDSFDAVSNTILNNGQEKSTGITNYTDIVRDKSSGKVLAVVSNNDGTIKSINLETAQVEQSFTLPFAGNVSRSVF